MWKRKATTQPFTVLGTLSEAQRLTKGSMWAILAPLFAFIVVSGALTCVFGLIFDAMNITDISPRSTWAIAYSLASLFLFLVACVFVCAVSGVLKVAIRRVRTHHIVPANVGFHAFSRFVPVAITAFFISFLLIVPVIFIALHIFIFVLYVFIIGVFFSLSLPLAVDKTNFPLAAMIYSAKTTSRYFLKISSIFLILLGIFFIAYLPLDIGLVFHSKIISIIGGGILFLAMLWFLPFKYLVLSVMYHKLIYKTPNSFQNPETNTPE